MLAACDLQHLDRPARPRHARAHHPDRLRISELAGLTVADITSAPGANVHCRRQGPQGTTHPAGARHRAVLRAWLAERHGSADEPLFPTSTGRQLSRDAIERRLALHVAKAASQLPVDHGQARHHAHAPAHRAMRLLLAGNDITVIALWLGHEQISTTNIYLHADMTQKERAIARSPAPSTPSPVATAPPTLLAFLEAL